MFFSFKCAESSFVHCARNNKLYMGADRQTDRRTIGSIFHWSYGFLILRCLLDRSNTLKGDTNQREFCQYNSIQTLHVFQVALVKLYSHFSHHSKVLCSHKSGIHYGINPFVFRMLHDVHCHSLGWSQKHCHFFKGMQKLFLHILGLVSNTQEWKSPLDLNSTPESKMDDPTASLNLVHG